MKYLRNKRTGKLVVFDKALLELGTYEEVVEVEPAKEAPKKTKKPKSDFDHDAVQAADEISISVQRGQPEE